MCPNRAIVGCSNCYKDLTALTMRIKMLEVKLDSFEILSNLMTGRGGVFQFVEASCVVGVKAHQPLRPR